MAIALNDNNRISYPIIKHQRIGESCQLAVIRWEQRDRLRKNSETNQQERIPNGVDRNNKPKFKQELVIHCLAMAGDMVAAIGDQSGVPSPGDRVRVILKSKGFGDWIEAKKIHRAGQVDRFNVGDILIISTTHAQQYDQDGRPKGAEIRSQADADAVPRNVTIGFYGPLTLHEATDPAWIDLAEKAYRADEAARAQANRIPLEDAQQDVPDDGYEF